MAFYYVNELTQEMTGPVELPEYPGLGVVVPGNAIGLPEALPAAEPGHVWVWRDQQAVQLIDLRNRTVYFKENGNALYWIQLGPLPDHLTVKPRPNAYCFWKEGDWVLDEEAERAGLAAQADIDRDNRLREAVIRVAPLQYAYELGEAGSDQVAMMQAWKRYAIHLSQIEQQADYPRNIVWPVAPGRTAVPPSA
ncbi:MULTISPECIES: tail fiber assembly protein [unclassified Pseudomonas]|uniref:tail fiber assembly protein n=1 Tax=unclassified Pseudomonas TaxID=196821 RepID=UPI000A1FB786|nr:MULTISPECIES: tail fiber assembly protein [unclassified Pseudomonas]